ncbi:MAG: hypothetical protein B6244_09255 [Candidatus Cloacimonetes bacterium 4572_55]|nr:MAG: hypothetical protein B6244_09255 [Candidatus Cloacimonetes bacterium 4572_55]
MNKSSFLLAIFLIAAIPQSIWAYDVIYSVTNDATYSIFSRTERDSLEERLELTLNIGNIQTGVLFDTQQPLPTVRHTGSGVGPVYLRKRFVEIEKSDLSLRVGDFSVIFGRGLSVNLFRDDNLPHDNEADGLKLTYQGEFGEAILFSGNVPKRYLPMSDLGYVVEEGKSHLFRGAMCNLKTDTFSPETQFLKDLKIGGHFMRFRGSELVGDNLTEYRRRLWGGMITYGNDWIDGYFEIVAGEKMRLRQDPITGESLSYLENSDDIRAKYGSLILFFDDFSFSAEWKDYNDFNFADQDAKPYHNPPVLRHQHISKALGRYLFQENLFGESGYKMEATYFPSFSTSITGSYCYIQKRKEKEKIFEEIYFKGEHELSDALSLTGLFAKNEVIIIGKEGEYTGGWVQAVYSLESGKTVTVTQEALRNSKKDFTEFFTAVTFAPTSRWSVTLSYDGTDQKEVADRENPWFSGDKLGIDDCWIAAELSYRIKNSHLLRVMVGDRREGWNCNGAVCTLEPAFSGLEVQLISSF